MSGLRNVAVGLAFCLALAGGAPVILAASQSQPADSARSQREADLDRLFRELQLAQTTVQANAIANEIWRIWTRGPDAQANRTLRRIMSTRRVRDFQNALSLCERLTKRLPGYSEGWNQKATVLFEMGRYDRSLDAIERVLELEPRHFGALAGKGMILMRQGRVGLAQKALRRAVEIHPFLPERRFLIEPPGERI